jgi:feruloyl-CoA synthase
MPRGAIKHNAGLPDIDACRRLAPHLDADTPPDAWLTGPQVRREFLFRLGAFAARAPNRIARMAFLTVPPSLDAGVITDKGSINQRTVLRHHAPWWMRSRQRPRPRG